MIESGEYKKNVVINPAINPIALLNTLKNNGYLTLIRTYFGKYSAGRGPESVGIEFLIVSILFSSEFVLILWGSILLVSNDNLILGSLPFYIDTFCGYNLSLVYRFSYVGQTSLIISVG